VTLTQFCVRYPEFADPDNSRIVSSCLVEAAAAIDQSVFGSRYDEAHGALTAHKLWTSAFGVSLRLDGSGAEGESKYLDHYNSIKQAVTVPLSMLVI
jgi:hypothetical protein